MACTVAVETVIGEHYNDQIRSLLDKGYREDELIAVSGTVVASTTTLGDCCPTIGSHSMHWCVGDPLPRPAAQEEQG